MIIERLGINIRRYCALDQDEWPYNIYRIADMLLLAVATRKELGSVIRAESFDGDMYDLLYRGLDVQACEAFWIALGHDN